MRILLVKPDARLRTVNGLHAFTMLEPLELGYLAAAVPPEHDVRILDLRLRYFPRWVLVRVLRRYKPHLVGITGYSHEASAVRELADTVKRHLPKAQVVVGGHHATVAPEDFNVEAIDAIVRGEGCTPFRDMVETMSKGEPLGSIPNCLIPGQNLVPAEASGWPEFPDPACLPAPRRDLWNARSYRSVWTAEQMKDWEPLFPPVSMVRASWGCRMKCSFCVVPQLYGGKHMPRPAEMVSEEIASAPARHIYFCDDENFIDEEFASDLAECLASKGIKKRYFAWTRSTTVLRSPELLEQWRRIGLDAVFLGFEFSTDEELRDTRKGATVASNEKALTTLRSMGIAVHAAFMIRPEWSEAQFRELRDYVRQMPPVQCSFTVCTPSPGTPDYQTLKKDCWVSDPYDLHDCMHPLTPTALPLRRFAKLYAGLARAGTARTPMRVKRHLTRPGDLLRVIRAERKYYRGFLNIHKDYSGVLKAPDRFLS